MKPTIGPKPTIMRPSIGKSSPLPAMVVPNKTALDNLKPTGSLQGDVDAEFEAIDQGFRDRMKQEEQRFDAATGSGEYFIVCFANGEQCGAFLAQLAAKVSSIKLDTDDLVVDGRDLARALGFAIPPAKAVGKLGKIDPDLKARSR